MLGPIKATERRNAEPMTPTMMLPTFKLSRARRGACPSGCACASAWRIATAAWVAGLRHGLEVEESPIPFVIFHIPTVRQGDLGHRPHKALHQGQGHLRRLMEHRGRGIGNIHEQHRQFFSRGQMLLDQVVLRQSRQKGVDVGRPRRNSRLPRGSLH